MRRSWFTSVLVALAIGCSTPKEPAGGDDGGADAGADACGCAGDADCPGNAFCSGGLCLPKNPAGTACSGNDQCTSGICGVVGAGHCCAVTCVKDSSHSCSPDDCNEVGVCSYPCSANCAKDADCRDPRICDHGACVYPDAGVAQDGGPDSGPVDSGPQCFIGGEFVPAGTWNPVNSCQQCDPSLSQLEWATTFSLAGTYSVPTGALLLGIWPFASTVGGPADTLLVGEILVDGTNLLLLFNGDMTIRSTLLVSSRPSLLATMDLNGDGLTDVVVGGITPSGPGVYSNMLSLYLNDSDGGFTRGALYASTVDTELLNDLRTGDFNGNGSQMLSVGVQVFTLDSTGNYVQSTRIDLYPLAGDGGLAAPSTVAQQLPRGSQLVGDFNGDGKTDILFAAPGSGTELTLFLSSGAGQFSASSEGYLADGGAYGEAVADFNADGRSDLVFPIYDTVDTTITLNTELADPQGHLGQPIASLSPPSPYLSSSLLAGDFDADGRVDLSGGTYQCQQSGCDGTLNIWLGVGDGTFVPPIAITPGLPSGWIASSEVAIDNAAGRKDLAVSYSKSARSPPYNNSYRVSVFRNGCR